ncbi:MAG: glycosyltransferase family 2 protein [bacterium]
MRNLVIIPVFNEEAHILEVLESIKSNAEEADILVVDDGSTDNTPRILEEARIGFLIEHQENQGYGQSLIEGFEFAIKKDYTYLVTIDCDAQHEPAYIPQFFEELKKFDIVSGSRYLPDSLKVDQPPEGRLEINKKITGLMRQYTGYQITDSFCGFKGYRVAGLKKLNLTERGYGMPLQLWLQAARVGLTVKEIPVPLIYKDQTRDFKNAFRSKEERLEYYLKVIKDAEHTCHSGPSG